MLQLKAAHGYLIKIATQICRATKITIDESRIIKSGFDKINFVVIKIINKYRIDSFIRGSNKFKLAPESHRPKLLSINAEGELIKALPFAKLLRAVLDDFCTYSILRARRGRR